MCGITGWVDFEHSPDRDPEAARTLASMTATLARRGPDADGYWIGRSAAVGHRRLAVIDPVGGVQPMSARAGRTRSEPAEFGGFGGSGSSGAQVVLTFSGEVYNHHQLRAELSGLGHRFTTRSDTEVVLHAYLEWGQDCPERLHGMFAFAVWDEPRRRLVLIRDRLGVKPLFLARTATGAVFGSEPKSLLAHPQVPARVDAAGLRAAYSLLFDTGPTIWAGIEEVHPGTVVTVDATGLHRRTYWQITAGQHTGTTEATTDTVGRILAAAAHAQLEADVPLCSLLSGGLDSTVLTALLAGELAGESAGRPGAGPRLRSYAVDYADQAEAFTPDELRTGHDTPYAAQAGAFIGTEHATVVLDPHELLDPAHRAAVVQARDSPIGVGDMDTSLYLLFGRIREHSTVALSGEGADEVFGGYPWFHSPQAAAAATFPWLLVTGDAAAMPLEPGLAAELKIPEYRADTYATALAAVPHVSGESPAEHRSRELRHLSLTRWLRQLLHRKDRLSMARGLEVRVPYCDHDLVQYAYDVPWAMHCHDGREKSLLRAVGTGLAPEAVLWRAKNHYPATHHPAYTTGLQRAAAQALADPGSAVREIADLRALEPLLTVPPEQLGWGRRLSLERVVDLAVWLQLYRPELTL